jgi:hypothetical protein
MNPIERGLSDLIEPDDPFESDRYIRNLIGENNMGLLAKKPSQSEGNYETPPQGAHLARVTRVIDLGTQEKSYKGETKMEPQMLITFELVDTIMTTGDLAGQPFIFNKKVKNSIHPESSYAGLFTALTGLAPSKDPNPEDYHPSRILNTPCQVQIIHKPKDDGGVWANLGAVMQVAPSTVVRQASTPLVIFDMDDLPVSNAQLELISEYWQNLIKASPEYAVGMS